ncbi:hypothetical protein QBC40DRAFT_203085, partial [Triangularia verruculosa]
MWSIPTLLASFLAFSKAVYSSPTPANDLLAGYRIVPMQWDFPIDLTAPDSTTVTVNGTIQEAIAQMEASYPGWNATYHARLMENSLLAPTRTSPMNAVLTETPYTFSCKTDSNLMPETSDIAVGIAYLRRQPGTAKNGPGPNECGRVSCSYDAAILWCNDNTYEKEVQWNAIADGAQFVCDKCRVKKGTDATTEEWYVNGQASFGDKWRVVVQGQFC